MTSAFPKLLVEVTVSSTSHPTTPVVLVLVTARTVPMQAHAPDAWIPSNSQRTHKLK
jgi:hypothetical protein